MFNIESWQEIFETIRKNKLRTFLTAFSVFLGIFILVILMGFSNGIENGVKSEFESDATNRISIRTGITTKSYNGLNPGRRLQLRNGDYDNLSQKYDEQIEYKTGTYSTWGGQVNYQQQQGNYRIEGANADQQFIENQSMVSGRFLNQTDIDEKKKVAVIGNQMKLDLFKDENPINKTILLNNNINFQVVGVYTDPGGNREESRLFIPLSTAQQVFNAGDDIRSIAYTVKMSDNFDEAVDLSMAMSQAIDQDLRSRFAVAPDDRAAVRVDNTLEQAQKIYGLIDTIRAVFWFIGIGTIIAGIVGVSNIMLIIVKERTKEIGIRKALGALPSQITGMILQEAIFITAIAGFIGLFAGVLAMEAISPLVETDFLKYPKADLRTSLTTVILLIVAGAIAGYIPARRAANIKPIEALRDE
ncbi:putative ABC transport system permease protein [Nonlabens sp. Hel1_33_55]|uniref:ABC transporter permease n=1 Tax=Nonlabens sp. Hel1_33_55 TaxID=1336802 RepID=UPI000875ED3B|nr:ABC transporter permease [Nonlabens sp. Hel1_33_55]SCY30428.1 putative ABC transport system permease protein [Nonlabens sp. Hel1_33_55]